MTEQRRLTTFGHFCEEKGITAEMVNALNHAGFYVERPQITPSMTPSELVALYKLGNILDAAIGRVDMQVSDKMRELVDRLRHEAYREGWAYRGPAPDHEHATPRMTRDAVDALLHEIASLEADRDRLTYRCHNQENDIKTYEIILTGFGVVRDAYGVWWKGNESADDVKEALDLFCKSSLPQGTPTL